MPRKRIDWAAIRREYESGVKTDRTIAAEYGVSHTAIQKRAKAEEWSRDLSARIRARRQAKVANAVVAKEVATENPVSNEQAIEANAELQKSIILGHRRDVRAARLVVNRLLAELGAKTLTEEEVLRLAGMATQLEAAQNDQKAAARLLEAFIKSMDLGGRAATAERLADAMAKLIQLERQAFGIDEKGTPDAAPLEERVRALTEPLPPNVTSIRRRSPLKPA